MADSAAHLVDEVFPKRPIRQWVLSVPFPLRFLFATNPQVMSRVLTIVHRVISTFLIKRSGRAVKSGAQSGAVTLIQRFGSALNLNLHFHMLYLGGVHNNKGRLNHLPPGLWPECWEESPDTAGRSDGRRSNKINRTRQQAGRLFIARRRGL